MKVELGRWYQDKVTGFAGVAVSRTTYLTGCARIVLQPAVGDDGKWHDSQWFDEPMLELQGSLKVEPPQSAVGAG